MPDSVEQFFFIDSPLTAVLSGMWREITRKMAARLKSYELKDWRVDGHAPKIWDATPKGFASR
jgi:hypothetical protein